MQLKKKVVQGLGWNLVASVLCQVLNVATKIIIARLLFPADFGLFTMAFLVINFLSIFVGFGIMSAVIYKKEEPEKTYNTAFVITLLLGFFLVSLMLGIFVYVLTFVLLTRREEQLKCKVP